jgi:hypothetical protein
MQHKGSSQCSQQLAIGLQSGRPYLLPSSFPTKFHMVYVYIIFPMHDSCSVHLIRLDFVFVSFFYDAFNMDAL